MKKIATTILLLLSATIVLAQSIKDYYIPDSAFIKATYYVNDLSGNETGFTRSIFYIPRGERYDITDGRFFNGNAVSVETISIQFVDGQVQMIKSITTNQLETNKKRFFNPAKTILKMPLNGKPITWILPEASGQKDIKTASLAAININGVEKKAIKVKTKVSGFSDAYTNEYYVLGVGLWETEIVSNGAKTIQYQFNELSNGDGTKHLMASELGNDSKPDLIDQSTQLRDATPMHLVTLEKGISLLSLSKSAIVKYLISQGYSFFNGNYATENFKIIKSGNEYSFDIQFTNSTLDAAEWSENVNNVDEYASKLERDFKFILDKVVDDHGQQYRVYKNLSRNLSIVTQYNLQPTENTAPFYLITVSYINKKIDGKVVSVLTDPRKMDIRNGKRIFTTLSNEQISQYYKKIGAERVNDHVLYLNCISISVSKSGKYNVIDLSRECD